MIARVNVSLICSATRHSFVRRTVVRTCVVCGSEGAMWSLVVPFPGLSMRQGFVVAPFDGKVAYAGGASYIAVECGDSVGVFPHEVHRG